MFIVPLAFEPAYRMVSAVSLKLTRRSENGRFDPGRRAVAARLRAPEGVSEVVASQRAAASVCHEQRKVGIKVCLS